MIQVIFNVLQAALQLWENKEKTKYVDKLISLRKSYHEEINKSPDTRSDAVLDDIEFELRVLSIAFSTTVTGSNVAV